MTRLVFDLRNVPDDEADEVRALLEAQGIAFYETRPAPLGLFAGGLWVKDEPAAARAREVIATYQAERGEAARLAYEAARREGTADTFATTLRREPLKVLVLLLSAVFIVALTVLPFLLFGGFAGAD